MTVIERRTWSADDVEMRSEGDGMTFTGYAIRYNSASQPLPFIETIAPGAATRSLKSRNEIKAFVNHDTNMVLGSTRAGTLQLAEDDKGVHATISLPDTTYGRDLAVSVGRKDVTGMSFGFSVPRNGDNWSEDGMQRTVTELRVHEVSPVTGFPAYTATTAGIRALANRTEQDFEALADAMAALESGEQLSRDQAALLMESIDRISVKDEPTAPAAPDSVPLSLLMKQHELVGKSL